MCVRVRACVCVCACLRISLFVGVGDSGNVDVWLFSWSGLGCLGGWVSEGGWARVGVTLMWKIFTGQNNKRRVGVGNDPK